jgi:hypothetical protein
MKVTDQTEFHNFPLQKTTNEIFIFLQHIAVFSYFLRIA